MNIIVVDDENMQLEMLKGSISEVIPDSELTGFTNPVEALAFARENVTEVAFLDIQMPVMDGIALAKKLKILNPKINLIFVTGYYAEYVFDAMPLYFSGYLQKPASAEKVRQALQNLRYPMEKPLMKKKLRVRCFGDFEVYADEKPLVFSRARSKEIFAYLVDRKGSKVNGKKICAVIFENSANEQSNKSNLRSCIADIREVLQGVDAEDVLLKGWDTYAIDPSLLDCDYYDWENGEPYAVRAFGGEYMSQYSWAEERLAFILQAEA